MFPAPAGMNRRIAIAYEEGDHVPRARGDEPVKGKPLPAERICSPRPRG